jgi:hypothetical protein
MLDHINGDVTETYDKYDMLKEKKAVVKILSDEIRRIVGAGPTERDARVHQGSVPHATFLMPVCQAFTSSANHAIRRGAISWAAGNLPASISR